MIRPGTICTYVPTRFDEMQLNTRFLEKGHRVRAIDPPPSCSSGGIGGMVYVEHLDGEFIGLVCAASLRIVSNKRKSGRKRPVKVA